MKKKSETLLQGKIIYTFVFINKFYFKTCTEQYVYIHTYIHEYNFLKYLCLLELSKLLMFNKSDLQILNQIS